MNHHAEPDWMALIERTFKWRPVGFANPKVLYAMRQDEGDWPRTFLLAVRLGMEDMVTSFMCADVPTELPFSGALVEAITHHHHKILTKLVNDPRTRIKINGSSALIHAVKCNAPVAIRILLDAKLLYNPKMSCINSEEAFQIVCKEETIELINLFMEYAKPSDELIKSLTEQNKFNVVRILLNRRNEGQQTIQNSEC